MKFFKREDRYEGHVFEDNVFLTAGRNCELKAGFTVKNGWYVRLQLPLTRTKQLTNPFSFEQTVVKARPCWFFLNRTKLGDSRSTLMKIFLWIPVNGWEDEHIRDAVHVTSIFGVLSFNRQTNWHERENNDTK